MHIGFAVQEHHGGHQLGERRNGDHRIGVFFQQNLPGVIADDDGMLGVQWQCIAATAGDGGTDGDPAQRFQKQGERAGGIHLVRIFGGECGAVQPAGFACMLTVNT